ncbi:hypothetical protein [Methylomonas fluvii]|nr:hypothetical protein [Methylomonas fluvii]
MMLAIPTPSKRTWLRMVIMTIRSFQKNLANLRAGELP